VISPLDARDKTSSMYKNCTGVIVSGIDGSTKADVSFMSHQYSKMILLDDEMRYYFLRDLNDRLQETKARCEPRTIDAIILGGNYFSPEEGVSAEEKELNDIVYRKFREEYKSFVLLLAEQIKDKFGFEPVVITGPKTNHGEEDAIFDTKHRRLYLIRPEVGNGSAESYLPSNFDEQTKKWNS